MSPASDPRPFAEVLRDWLTRRNLTAYAAAPVLGVTKETVMGWTKDRACPHERAFRALMTLVDEGGEKTGSVSV